MAGSAREEAERLVAAILARAASAGAGAAARGRRDSGDSSGTTQAPAAEAAAFVGNAVDGFFSVLNDVARGHGDGTAQQSAPPGWATGSAECCVCPVCRAIAAVRDPSPETVFKVATGAGDIATGAASVLRGFSSLAGSVLGDRPRQSAKPAGGGAARHAPSPDQAWSAATRAADPPPAPTGPGAGAPDPEADPWAAATAESAREADAARARARAAEQAVAKAVADARRTSARKRAVPEQGGRPEAEAAGVKHAGVSGNVPGGRVWPGADVWSVATSEAAASDPAGTRSVDHVRGASAPEDRDAATGDGAHAGDAM
ncbi:hypothetical protein [Actinoplanes regularis]|uniref:hypothetical protein n=1 Tax=Actinoplanes regularis TaxID=52697 RepID=UPI0024A10EFE|nr:hypothetical protein [Actinoplanes regularis]GLW32449.1 hypothetical protein Areg01_53870 [Actinoplanes regularis]